MKRYDTLELSDPKTYLADDELATAARAVATIHFKDVFSEKMGRGAAKRAVLNGEYPHLVKQYVDCLCAAAKQAEENIGIIKTIVTPRDYSIIIEGNNVCIRGPYDDNLAQRVKRQKGYWGSASDGGPRDCLIIALDKAPAIKRIFVKWTNFRNAEKKQLWELKKQCHAEKAEQKRKRDVDRRAEASLHDYYSSEDYFLRVSCL